MTKGKKAFAVATVVGGLWWWYNSRLPKIRIIRIIPEQGGIMYYPPGVEFEMSIEGNVIRDTFYQGDERQVILSDDLNYYFISEASETGVMLSIEVLNENGGFTPVASGYIAYDYSGNDLPVRIAKGV